jgi:hypothetical protein
MGIPSGLGVSDPLKFFMDCRTGCSKMCERKARKNIKTEAYLRARGFDVFEA